jgi:hypothetical protein
MTELLTTMKQRLADAETDAKRLRAAIKVLDAEQVAKPAEPRIRRQSSAAKVSKTPAKVVPLGKLLKIVGERDGLTATKLAKDTGGEQSAILVLLKEAEADGKLPRTGQRRGTRWHVTNGA